MKLPLGLYFALVTAPLTGAGTGDSAVGRSVHVTNRRAEWRQIQALDDARARDTKLEADIDRLLNEVEETAVTLPAETKP